MNFLFSQKIVPVILLILLVLVWSSVWSLFRVAMEVIPPLSFRVIIGLPAFILLLFLGFKKMKTVNIPSNEWKPLLLISFFNVTLWQVLMLYGIGMLGGGIAAVLTYTMPIWATIFASMFGYEKINTSIIISLLLGMFGIFFLSIEINIFENIFGFLITLSAGLSWAIGTMIVKYRMSCAKFTFENRWGFLAFKWKLRSVGFVCVFNCKKNFAVFTHTFLNKK